MIRQFRRICPLGGNCYYSTSSKTPQSGGDQASHPKTKGAGRANATSAAKDRPESTKSTSRAQSATPPPPPTTGYQVPEYYEHNTFSYVDYEIAMKQMRLPQPSSQSKK